MIVTANDMRVRIEKEIRMYQLIKAPALMPRFVLRNGSGAVGVPLPSGFPRAVPKACYQNATRLALNEGLDYWEGYVWTPGFPLVIQHAWNTDAAGALIDVTLQEPQEYLYWGVHFPVDILRRELLKNEYYGLLEDACGMINVDLYREIDPDLMAPYPNRTRA